jgi:hypothetical protein
MQPRLLYIAESSETNVKYGEKNMTIGSIGSYSGASYAGGNGGDMSAEQADAALEAAEEKKRKDGVKNAFKAAENANTSGIKSASDMLRL